jgi:hypothetical protein
MDSMAFNVIAQGPFYKKWHLPDKFWEHFFLSSSYMLSVGIIFCHIHNNPEMQKRRLVQIKQLAVYKSLQAPRNLQSRL